MNLNDALLDFSKEKISTLKEIYHNVKEDSTRQSGWR